MANNAYLLVDLQFLHTHIEQLHPDNRFIGQGLYQLGETSVQLRCKQNEAAMVQEILPSCIQNAKKNLGIDVKVTVNQNKWLSPQIAGGVELFARDGKIYVSCTLESRLELLSRKLIPEIRASLFGGNPNRKYTD